MEYMMTSPNGNIFPRELPFVRSFDVLFDLRMN